tara:strand:- start:1312 stop:2628 length:1317 start_codon:yes stop_codon:yes gene_type:complete
LKLIKINKNKYFLFLTLGSFLTSDLKGQFLDTTDPLRIMDFPVAKIRSGLYSIDGNFRLKNKKISGIAVRIKAKTIESFVLKISEGKEVSSLLDEIMFFPEPFSDRIIAVYRPPKSFYADSVIYDIKSRNHIKILSIGIFNLEEKENLTFDENIKRLDHFSNIQKPTVISRSSWDADPPKSNYNYHPYFDKLTLHHAAGWQAWTIEEGKKQVKAIQEFHQAGRGWNDIGYHFVVDMGGNIYQGRPETVIGAHVNGANTGNIGVCILGCYHPPETNWSCFDVMTKDTENALVYLYSWIADSYNIDPNVLLGHRDYFGTTSCPGNNIWPAISSLREEIVLFISGGGPPLSFRLFANYPNPFNSLTNISFQSMGRQTARIMIADLQGRIISSINSRYTNYGKNIIQWNGLDKYGLETPSGVYFYTVTIGEEKRNGKMLLIK